MKIFTKNGILQKIIISIMICILVMFAILPHSSYAADDEGGWDLGGALIKELFQLVSWIGDMVMGALNNFMLGAPDFSSAMLDNTDVNLEPDFGSWLAITDSEYSDIKGAINPDDNGSGQAAEMDGEQVVVKTWPEGTITTSFLNSDGVYSIPNMLYSPENIFANKIAALDINFLQANTFSSIYGGGGSGDNFEQNAENRSQSAATTLKETIASWYRAFRNIAIVGLMSVLIYLGIRIIISSTADDKAKYKESLKNWFVALCLVFVIHFIMSGILMLTDRFNSLFASQTDNIVIAVQDPDHAADNRDGYVVFRTNLMGSIRFQAQRKNAYNVAAFTVLYVALVIYTCIFTFMYFKRFLYMAFFTMIAPLVALTYPIDKVGDGKAQAFNLWFKEYTMNAIIQPIHLILYTVFIGSAANLVDKNPLYALVAMAFLIPAEKFIKKMFGLDRSETAGDFGSFAGGAIAMTGMQKLAGLGGKGSKRKPSGSGARGGAGSEGNNSTIFMPARRGSFQNFKNSANGKNQQQLGANNKETQDTQQQQALAAQQAGQHGAQNNQQLAGSQAQQLAGAQTQQLAGAQSMQPFDNGVDAAYLNANQPATQDNARDISSSSTNPALVSAQPSTEKPKIKGYRRNLVKRTFKNAGRAIVRNRGAILRTAGSIAGAGVGAAIGLGAGLTTGDLSKSLSMAGIGATAGGTIGNRLGHATNAIPTAVATRIQSGVNKERTLAPGSIGNAINEEEYGMQYAQEMRRRAQNQRAREELLKDKNKQREYAQLANKMGYQGDVRNLMNAAADYQEAGIKDEDLIKNSIKAEYSRDNSTQFKGNTHEQFIDVAKFASDNKFGADYIDDDKKRNSLENVIRTQSGLDPEGQRQVAQTFADIQGRGDLYREKGTLGKPQAKILTGGEADLQEAKKAATQNNNSSKQRGRPRTKK